MHQSTGFLLFSFMVLAAATASALPPTTGAQWWTTDSNLNCTAYHSLAHEIALASGGKGYACGVTGTFIWSVAGGTLKTSFAWLRRRRER